MTSLLRLARALRREDGVALPTVMVFGVLMLAIVGGAMSIATRGIQKTNTDEDFVGALAAAYAGIEDYQSRLANDSNYQKFGNPSALFSSTSASTVSLPTGANANAAFGVGTSGTWASIPKVDPNDVTKLVPSGATFRYEVDNSDYQDKGVLHLRSTGRVGKVTRTVIADLKQDGFIDYLWFTNFETADPAISANSAAALTDCEKFAYGSSARNDTTCPPITFRDVDVLRGPVHSNDRMLICEATFEKGVTTSSTTSPLWRNGSGCSNPNWLAGDAKYAAPLPMPPTNTEMKKETRNDLTADVPRPGCLYTGPTTITFETVGGVSKMRVISPWTRFTNVAATKAAATNPTQCGVPGSGANQLGGPTGQVLPVLERNLIYVQAVPAVGANDANAPTTAALPAGFTCTSATTVKVKDTGDSNKLKDVAVPAGWKFVNTVTSAVTAQYPYVTTVSGETVYETTPWTGSQVASTYKHYDCRAGDVYIQGALGGQLTVASDNFIYVTGDLTYKDAATDVLGLVGQNAVFVWNPVRVSGFSGTSSTPDTWTGMISNTNRTINAAILSVGHTFQAQNYSRGARGTLTVYGAIAQKFRGTVSTTDGNGYAKDYRYDERFRNIAPPKFLTPTSTTYGVTQVAAVPPAFKYTGEAITGP
jgi:hypothetical protein